jgi:hypothetical protein
MDRDPKTLEALSSRLLRAGRIYLGQETQVKEPAKPVDKYQRPKWPAPGFFLSTMIKLCA